MSTSDQSFRYLRSYGRTGAVELELLRTEVSEDFLRIGYAGRTRLGLAVIPFALVVVPMLLDGSALESYSGKSGLVGSDEFELSVEIDVPFGSCDVDETGLDLLLQCFEVLSADRFQRL